MQNSVLEFGSAAIGYMAAILYWAPIRRDLYLKRLTRQRIITELAIVEETELVRYITMAHTLNLARINDDDAASALLTKHKFPKIYHVLLHNPQFTENSDLVQLIMQGVNSSHDYILNLKERELVKSSMEKRQKRITTLQSELTKIIERLEERPMAGASIWLSEIDEFNV